MGKNGSICPSQVARCAIGIIMSISIFALRNKAARLGSASLVPDKSLRAKTALAHSG